MRLDTIYCFCFGYCRGHAIGYYRLLLFWLLYGQCDWILQIVVVLVIVHAMRLDTIECCCFAYGTHNVIGY